MSPTMNPPMSPRSPRSPPAQVPVKKTIKLKLKTNNP
jgi:hypothetical protein